MKVVVKKYNQWLGELKTNIHQSRLQTALKVNTDMLLLYWYIGKQIAEKIATEGRGIKVIEQLADDLQKEFPDMQGFSVRSLKYMQKFAIIYPDLLIVQQPAALLQKKQVKLIKQQANALIKKDKNPIVQQAVAQLERVKVQE